MKWLDKLTGANKEKETATGGFDILKRLTAGSSYTDTSALETYEKSLYVAAAVGKIAQKVATIDWSLYQIMNSRGDRKEIVVHPALDLLRKVNPFQTKQEFLEITIINKKLTGDAFWYKVRNERGQVTELWNLRPDRVTIVTDPVKFIKEYRLKKADGTDEVFAPENIVHLKAPSPLSAHNGTSPLKGASIRVDTEEYATQHQRDLFLNSARPDAILKASDILSRDQKRDIRDSWSKRHKGPGKSSKIAVLEGGLEYQQISLSPRELDYIESMKFTRDDILVAFGVPKPIVAVTDDVNRANAETAMHIFLAETVKPEMDMLNEKVNEALIIPDFGANLLLDFIDPTPENREQVTKEYETGIKNGYLLINEVRAKENLQPVDGGWEFYMPLSMQPVGGLSKKNQKSLEEQWQAKKEAETEKAKLKVFKGRSDLYKQFIEYEKTVSTIRKTIKKNIKRKGKPTAILKTEIVRKSYGTLINKIIDRRTERMADETKVFFSKQLTMLKAKLANIDYSKGIGNETKAVVKDFYKDEVQKTAEFVIPFMTEAIEKAGMEAMALIEPEANFSMTAAITKRIKGDAKTTGAQVNKTTGDKIIKAIDAGVTAGEGNNAIGDRIAKVYNEVADYRADMIARTVTTASNNEGTLQAFKQSSVATHKEWIATHDSRTRDEHRNLDGEIVKTGEQFSNGLDYPQEPNCRCVIAPAMLE